MSFSHSAGVGLVPTIARIVLGLAFITVGYHKVAGTAVYTQAEAQQLGAIGIELDPIAPTAATPSSSTSDPTRNLRDSDGGAFLLQAALLTVSQDVDPDADADADQDQTPPDDDAIDDIDVATILTADSYRGKAMWKVALILDNNDFPEPKLMTMIAAWTEFIGGILVLLGFLTRIWGLGLAIAMAVAFYLTSMDAYLFPFPKAMFDVAANDLATYNRVFAQLGLLALGLGVFFTGPGPISLDRLIFPRRTSRYVVEGTEPSVQL